MEGGAEAAVEDRFVGGEEMDMGAADLSPSARNGREDAGLLGGEEGLLVCGELDHSAALGLGRECGEDAAVEAKLRLTHVGGFEGSFKTEGKFLEEGDLLVQLGCWCRHLWVPSESLFFRVGASGFGVGVDVGGCGGEADRSFRIVEK